MKELFVIILIALLYAIFTGVMCLAARDWYRRNRKSHTDKKE